MNTAPASSPASPMDAPAPTHVHDHVHDDDAPHGDDHVHTYETSGIMEGNARVPRWLLAAIITLFAFFVWYVATQWGAQPTSARLK